MSYVDGTIRASQCLNYRKRQGGYEVTHILSGRKFHISEPTREILHLLRDPRDYALISAELANYYTDEEIEQTLMTLRRNGMLVGEGDDETYHLKKTNGTLFGVPNYRPGKSSAAPRCVLAGIPFGGGNTMDAQCGEFPGFLRIFSQNYLETLGRRPQDVDFRFLGADADRFDNLRQLLTEGRVVDAGDLYIHATEFSSSVYEKIERLTSEISAAADVPVLIGGDHSISYAAIKGVAECYERIQIVQFDAHVDTYDSRVGSLYTNSGRASHHHGTFLSRALELGQVAHVHQFGIRGVFNIRPRAFDRCSIHWAHETQALLKGENPTGLLEGVPVYVTFDIDFFDPSVAPGTATPVAGGPHYAEGLALLEKVLGGHRIIGADLVEVNARRDQSEQTIQLATTTLLNLINNIKS